jgi:hypothetical protein
VIKFKSKLIEERFDLCHPKLKAIAEDLAHFCEESDEEFTITDSFSTASEDKKLNRVSSTHREGRAFDVSIKGWDKVFLGEFVHYANSRYKQYGALGPNDVKRLCVVHDNGNGNHCHIQLNRVFTMSPIKEDN